MTLEVGFSKLDMGPLKHGRIQSQSSSFLKEAMTFGGEQKRKEKQTFNQDREELTQVLERNGDKISIEEVNMITNLFERKRLTLEEIKAIFRGMDKETQDTSFKSIIAERIEFAIDEYNKKLKDIV